MVSLEFFIDLVLLATLCPGVNSASNRNEYQGYLMGIKQLVHRAEPCHPHVPIVLKFWDPEPPGVLRVYPGMYRDSFYTVQCLFLKLTLQNVGVHEWSGE